jgi:hypothetical protein
MKTSLTIAAGPLRPHILHFPCVGENHDWFAEVSGSGKPGVTTALLSRQRDFERDPRNEASAHVTCAACGDPRACFMVCQRAYRGSSLLYLRRWPNTKHLHAPSCHSYHSELIPPEFGEAEGQAAKPTPIRGDFAPLVRETLDPELRLVVAPRPYCDGTHSQRPLNRTISRPETPSVGLRRFACELLQNSGLCDGHPRFSHRREERDFNGLVKRELDSLQQANGGGRAARLLRSLPAGAQMIPWSYLDYDIGRLAPAELSSCVAFGFIQGLGPPNERGARAMTLANHPDLPILLAAALLSEFANDLRSPFRGEALPFRTWVMVVAGRYDGVWKAHKLAWFRISEVGLIPVESEKEEQMVERLVAERRFFRRWLVPPPGIGGARIVPDFQLLDTLKKEFIEVAGMMSDPEYAARIARKVALLGDRLLVWYTSVALGKFVLPPSSAI